MSSRLWRFAGLVVLTALGVGGCRSDASIVQGHLPEILLEPNEALPGLSYDPSLSGPADVYLEGQFAADWPPSGYESSYQRVFQDSAPEDPETFPVEKLRGLVSVAMLFRSAEDASAHLSANFPSSWWLDVDGFDTLGEERRGLVTETTGGFLADSAARPRRTTLIWRRANVFLQLNVLGEYPLEDVITLARAVDSRAVARLRS